MTPNLQRRDSQISRTTLDQDIDLPPAPCSRHGEAPVTSRAHTGTSSRVAWAAGLLAIAAIGGTVFLGMISSEKTHPNWRLVEAATEASAVQTTNAFVQIDPTGSQTTITAIELTSRDLDSDTSRALRAALRRNDLRAAAASLRLAQQFPMMSAADLQLPEVTTNARLVAAIATGSEKFYQLHVYDCCDEDGDVVQVVVNGQPFMTIPITNQGASISIPLSRGSNTLSLRGIRDGGGGITVSFRTSQGEFFSSRMRVGEEHNLGVVVR